jgi:uncharacterized Zn-binding protein involved in type VI secretion
MTAGPHHLQENTRTMARIRMLAVAITSTVAAGLAVPALAADAPSTRLVSCGAQSCLLVSGHRASGDAEVRINGHPVAVEGERNWRARLPVSTVREWSVPFARKIEVSSGNAETQDNATAFAKLPIGLLGHVPDLASLVITLN